MECSDHHLHGARTAAPPGLCSPCVGGAPSTRPGEGQAWPACQALRGSRIRSSVHSASQSPQSIPCPTPAVSATCRRWAGGSATSHLSGLSRVLGGLPRPTLAESEMYGAVGVAVVTGTWRFWGVERMVTEAGEGRSTDLFLETTQYE